MTIRSQPYFVLDVPTIEDLSAKFIYEYFTPGESVYPGSDDITNDPKTLASYGYPRKTVIEFSHSIRELQNSDAVSRGLAEEIITSSNLSKAETETQLQNQNASRLTFNIDPEFLESFYQHPEYDKADNHYTAAVNLANSLNGTAKEVFNIILENTKTPAPIEFEPTTNMPIVEFDEIAAKQKTSSVVFDYALGDIVSTIVNDPLSTFSDDFIEHELRSSQRQSESRGIKTPGLFNMDDYSLSIDLLDKTYIDSTSIEPFAFVIYKTRIEGNERIVENPIILINPNKKNIVDTSILYGATYEYSVHTLAIGGAIDDNKKHRNFLVLSKDSKKITVTCEERNPPPTVTDVNFRFLDSTMLIRWDLPIETNSKLIPVNDIKYVQVFRRNSVAHAYELIRMFDFNDSLEIYDLGESIPDELIEKNYRSYNELEVMLPDQRQDIYAIATVDAHGNSSFLSAQYSVSIDSLKRPQITHIAYPGSPKQYPNLTMVDDVFTDSIRVSNYKKINIYHNPEFTILLNGKNEQKLVSVHADVPSYILQLIDVKTQKDEKIEIFMREN